MNRKDIYNKIKEYKLEEEVKKVYGKNYTNISTTCLYTLILKHQSKMKDHNAQEVNIVIESPRLNKLIEVLAKKRILLKSEIEYINA